MTHVFHPIEHNSSIHTYIVGALTATVLALSVLMLFGQFAA